MCKSRINILAIVIVSCMLLSSPVNAALVELIVTGEIDRSRESVRHTIGSNVTVRSVYETSFVDTEPYINTGRFYDWTGNTTSLISISIITDLGTVDFVTANSSQLYPPIVTQLLSPGISQVLDVLTISPTGFTGSIGEVTAPYQLRFILSDADLNNIFTNPNELVSGNSTVPNNLSGMFGYIGVKDNFFYSEFDFSATSYSIRAVPVPASVWLFGNGLIGIFSFMRRKIIC